MIHVFQPNKVFLIDGIGAAISAILLLTLVVPFEPFLGFPSAVAVKLAILPMVFCVYSLTCHFSNPSLWSLLLKIIAVCNIIYCLVTVGLVITYFSQLTVFGVLYFLIEKVIVIPLAMWEWKVSKRK